MNPNVVSRQKAPCSASPDHKKAEYWLKAPYLLSVLVLRESDLVSFHELRKGSFLILDLVWIYCFFHGYLYGLYKH